MDGIARCCAVFTLDPHNHNKQSLDSGMSVVAGGGAKRGSERGGKFIQVGSRKYFWNSGRTAASKGII